MYPWCRVFGYSFSTYRILHITALLVGVFLFWIETKRKRLKKSYIFWVPLAIVIGAFFGSKLYNIVEEIPLGEFLRHPVQIFISSGATHHGGFLGALFLVWIISLLAKENFIMIADTVAPILPLITAIGRTGCFMAGCCFGKPTHLPWAVSFPKAHPPVFAKVHPVQLYEVMIMIGIFLYMWKVRKKSMPPSRLFSLFLLFWGVERFFLEFIRVSTPSPLPVLSIAQLVSIIFVIIAILNLIRLRHYRPRKKRIPS